MAFLLLKLCILIGVFNRLLILFDTYIFMSGEVLSAYIYIYIEMTKHCTNCQTIRKLVIVKFRTSAVFFQFLISSVST